MWIELVAQRLPGTRVQGAGAEVGKAPEGGAGRWYSIDNAAEDTAEIFVYDAIGGWCGVTPEDFVRDLGEVKAKNINLRINSPGGGVFDGITIANALRSHPATVTTYVDGLAASIASVIALAGDRVVMMPQSQLMIHDAAGMCFGNQAEMTEMAALLDKQSQNIAQAYAARTGKPADYWRDLMKAETWFLADEAVEVGLADEARAAPRPGDGDEGGASNALGRVSSVTAATAWDLSAFRYAGRENAPSPRLEPEAAPVVEEQPVVDEACPPWAEALVQDIVSRLIEEGVVRAAPAAEPPPLSGGDGGGAEGQPVVSAADEWLASCHWEDGIESEDAAWDALLAGLTAPPSRAGDN